MKKRIIVITLIIILSILLILFGTTYLYLKKADLSIPERIKENYNFEKDLFQDKTVYRISPKQSRIDKVILYLHGGSYITNLTKDYWKFFADVIDDTGATFIIPDYPLAPKYCYKDVFEMMSPLYKELVRKIGADNIIIMGDSAGGGLGLALCQKNAKENIVQPSKLILISPWLDLSMNNEKIDEVQKNDPLLNKYLLKLAGSLYARNEDINNYLVSPINGDLDKLENIYVFSGTYDILNPDADLFVEKAKSKGININYIRTKNAVHIWVLLYRDEDKYNAKYDYQKLLQAIKE